MCRDADRDIAGRHNRGVGLDGYHRDQPCAGRPFAELETDGGAERLFDFVRENLTPRLVDAAQRCMEVIRAEESAAAGGYDRAAGPDPLPTARRRRWRAARRR